MKPPPFLISTAAVINYVCPTPNTNIVIFGGENFLIYFIVVAEGVRWMASHHGHLQGWGGGEGERSGVEDMDRAGPGKPSLQGKNESGSQRPCAGIWLRLSRNLIRLSLNTELHWYPLSSKPIGAARHCVVQISVFTCFSFMPLITNRCTETSASPPTFICHCTVWMY